MVLTIRRRARRSLIAGLLVASLAGCAGTTPSGPPVPGSTTPQDTADATGSFGSFGAATSAPTAATTGAPASPSPEPVVPSPPPTMEPAEGGWATEPGRPLLIGAAIHPTVDLLNVRERPWLAAKVIAPVTSDEVLEVLSPPFRADGHIWHHVVVVSASGRLPDLPQHLVGVGEPLVGWVAVRTGDTHFVAALDPRCPDTVNIRYVYAMLGAERLACFGNDVIEFEGVWADCYCRWPQTATFAPRWLADWYHSGSLSKDPTEGINRVSLRFPPDGPAAPEERSIVRVRGHFDDHRADRCEFALPFPWDFDVPNAEHDIGAASSTLECRQAFVVDSYEVIGAYTGEWPDYD